MEKGPEIRTIGGASSEKREKARKEIENNFFKHFESLSPNEQEIVKKLEYPKSEKEIALIDFANKETSELMQELGLESYNIPVNNFHIFPPETYNKATAGGRAATFFKKQGAIFNAEIFRDNPVLFGSVVLHEILHLKAHFSIEVQEEEKEEISVTPYRQGVSVNALQKHGCHGKYHQHFTGLHEAIVAEAQKRLTEKLINQPELSEEKKWLTSIEAKEKKKKISKEKNISEDDIIWVNKEDDKWEAIAYLRARNVLNYVCSEIQKQFPDKYESMDDVYMIFLKAHFTGQLMPIARLVEKTFGKGSFRLLGNMDDNSESGVLHLESFKKLRAQFK